MIKTALYCGSFNPFHIGHKNIADKAADIFGKENVILGFGLNPSKNAVNNSLTDELKQKLSYKCLTYKNYLHEFIFQLENDGYDIVLVRGLRNGDDLAYETNQLKYINDLSGKIIKTIFFQCDEKYNHISSSSIRAMNNFKPDSGNIYLP